MDKQYPSCGDHGTSKLVTGAEVGKNHPNFEAVGSIDELNCVLGWVKCVCDDPETYRRIEWLQNRLLDLGGHVTGWSVAEFGPDYVACLEQQIRQWHEAVPDIQSFILPDGTELAARFHIARAVCRRAEREIARWKATGLVPISDHAMQFINRLSDWLYMAARWTNVRTGTPETLWKKD